MAVNEYWLIGDPIVRRPPTLKTLVPMRLRGQERGGGGGGVAVATQGNPTFRVGCPADRRPLFLRHRGLSTSPRAISAPRFP